MKSPREFALVLLEKAGNDLVAARATIATGQALDMVCFHAQQTVEKCLKALLALRDVEYPWRHDLGELAGLVRAHYPNLDLHQDRLMELAPYAVAARYDEAWKPDAREAQEALALAETVHQSIVRLIEGDGR